MSELEQKVHNCLSEKNLSLLPKIIDSYIGARINIRPRHGYWVHGLSHFDSQLWELKQFDLLKKLYMEAVTGAIETEDLNCLQRIMFSFLESHSSESGTKDEYGMSVENLEKLKSINNFFVTKVLYFGIEPEIIEKVLLK